MVEIISNGIGNTPNYEQVALTPMIAWLRLSPVHRLRPELLPVSTGESLRRQILSSMLEGEDKTQKDVAEACGVTEVTIRNRYKGLRLALGI
jgi:hypothetical protein